MNTAARQPPAGAQGPTLAAGTSAAPAGQSQQGGAGSVNDGLGHPVNVCALLPVATVASITGEPLTVATEADTLSYKIYHCDYTNAAGSSGLGVSVLAQMPPPATTGNYRPTQAPSKSADSATRRSRASSDRTPSSATS